MNSVKAAYLNPITACDLGAVRWVLFLTVFTALAIFLPYTCHQFGLAGMVFLPMHFAVLIAAIVMGLRGGVIVALISPAFSFAISGMPPAASLAPMTIELAAYAVAVNIAVGKLKMPLVLSLVAAMLAGRFISIALVSVILQNTPLTTQLHNVFVVGIPGILIQLALVPLLSARIVSYLGNR